MKCILQAGPIQDEPVFKTTHGSIMEMKPVDKCRQVKSGDETCFNDNNCTKEDNEETTNAKNAAFCMLGLNEENTTKNI